MLKMSIKPQWLLEGAQGPQPMPHLLNLLLKVHETHTLAKAAAELGLSYRYAWGVLQDGHRAFGVPLVKMQRGRGAVLTPLGEKLVWADRRIAARLSPLLDSLASELEVEVERALSHEQNILRLHASHGFAVQTLRQWLLRDQVPVDLKYRNVQEALGALNSGSCDLAGFHVPLGELEGVALQHYLPALRPGKHRLVHLATRRQGLMVAPHNPKNITGVADLARPGISYVNRHEGSGTRLLLDLLLQRAHLNGRAIQGYDNCEFTHPAVAAYVASGMADAGLGVEPAARRFELEFLPVASERYFFVCNAQLLATPMMLRILDTLRSREFQRAVSALPGYDGSDCGTVQDIAEAFPGLAATPPARRRRAA
ncbi:MAG TPA: substrate-binding domain-containing protein [Nevskia sp.]|nr:substrate-binding domain-containing protein [Nevskia sp.]